MLWNSTSLAQSEWTFQSSSFNRPMLYYPGLGKALIRLNVILRIQESAMFFSAGQRNTRPTCAQPVQRCGPCDGAFSGPPGHGKASSRSGPPATSNGAMGRRRWSPGSPECWAATWPGRVFRHLPVVLFLYCLSSSCFFLRRGWRMPGTAFSSLTNSSLGQRDFFSSLVGLP